MHYEIRPATRADCPRLLELVRELAAYEKAPDAVTVTPAHFVESGFGSHPVWWAFVAEAEGRIDGFALYYIRFSTWKGQMMYLEDILVTQERRGRGIGKLLFDQLVAEAREKGLAGMIWQVLEWNRSAIDFYLKRGAVLDPEWVNCRLEV